jgi:hypothetical protein
MGLLSFYNVLYLCIRLSFFLILFKFFITLLFVIGDLSANFATKQIFASRQNLEAILALLVGALSDFEIHFNISDKLKFNKIFFSITNFSP